MTPAQMQGAETEVWNALRSGIVEKPHELWLRAGEFAAAHGNLRRALGSWRRALEVDFRGEKTAVLHEGINTLSQVLLQQRKYFLHVQDDSLRQQWLVNQKRTALECPPMEALVKDLENAKATATGSVQGTLELCAKCVSLKLFDASLSDVALSLDLKNAGLVTLAAQFQAFQLWSYDAMLNKHEPSKL